MDIFTPKQGPALAAYIVGGLIVSALVFFALSVMPARMRKPLIALVTFLAGLFFALEFFWPVGTSGPDAGKNFLTPYIKPVSDGTTVLQAFALGLGVYSLGSIHLRAVARRRAGWGFSVVLLGAIAAMAIPAILKEYHPNRYNKALYAIMYDGAFTGLNSTMFALVAFYIVSAAYRAFRIRSLESTILLGSALFVMLGQVALGQALTSGLPNDGFAANGRMENIATWILNKVNSPALLAIDLGLGIGMLAASLRLWLSLERGSYFEKEL